MIETELERVLPGDIEKRSFEMITEELGDRILNPEYELVIKRVIHTTADFDYADNLMFSEHAVEQAKAAIRQGVRFITDTNMGKAGINRSALQACGCRVDCFMAWNHQSVCQHGEGGRIRRRLYLCCRQRPHGPDPAV